MVDRTGTGSVRSLGLPWLFFPFGFQRRFFFVLLLSPVCLFLLSVLWVEVVCAGSQGVVSGVLSLDVRFLVGGLTRGGESGRTVFSVVRAGWVFVERVCVLLSKLLQLRTLESLRIFSIQVPGVVYHHVELMVWLNERRNVLVIAHKFIHAHLLVSLLVENIVVHVESFNELHQHLLLAFVTWNYLRVPFSNVLIFQLLKRHQSSSFFIKDNKNSFNWVHPIVVHPSLKN